MFELSVPILATFVVYLVGMIAIGAWLYRRTSSLSDFAIGGRRLNAPTAALSAQASDMSAWLLMGLPGAVYASGIGSIWMAGGLALGSYLNWLIVAGRLRTFTERAGNAVSLSAYFESRFQDRTTLLRLVSAAVILVFFTVYVASGLVAGGKLFNSIFGVEPKVAIAVSVVVIIVYTFLGGFLAVSLTDALQGTLMFFALLVVPLIVVWQTGGFGDFFSDLQLINPDILNARKEVEMSSGDWISSSGTLGFIGIVSLAAWGFGYFGQPHILARFMGIKSAAHVPTARRIGTTWIVLSLAFAVMVGLAGIVYFDEQLADSEMVFVALTTDIFNSWAPWISGIILAAVLAAVMSTADSQLLVSSTAVTEDFYRRYFKRDAGDSHLLWVGRAAVIGVALVAYILTLWNNDSVLEIVSYAWAGFGAAFGPVIVASLYWRNMTWVGAFAGMIGGAATVIVWESLGSPYDLYSIVPGLVVAVLAILGGSFLGQKPEVDLTPETKETVAAE
ncbi:sodium/proline symporter PutP [Haloglycomyces albus]|uniref:sodium/proline symporter PutP n=1 Tax=Haloglycomyces albus TaxID=526067 RepID=UPI00046CCC67|nr:sodium/proline symporter PutP [Haloglycomyces albus]